MVASADRPRLNGAGDDAPPAVAAVVVNFNAGDALARCVESVLAQKLGVRLVVVDNASSDGSADRVGELYGRRDDVSTTRSRARARRSSRSTRPSSAARTPVSRTPSARWSKASRSRPPEPNSFTSVAPATLKRSVIWVFIAAL